MTEVFDIRPYSSEIGIQGAQSIFLAGTIDMGNSDDWQEGFIHMLKDDAAKDTDPQSHNKLAVFNPRRHSGFNTPDDGRDSDAIREDMEYQISWELEHMERADAILMNLLPDSKSPISLLELGLWCRSGKLTVICSPEFYRYANVKAVCNKYRVKLYSSMEDYMTN